MTATIGPAHGALLIHGGGNIDDNFNILFRRLVGGSEANIAYIPTAFSDSELASPQQHHMDSNFAAQRFGFRKATILHTRDRNVADSESFVQPLATSSGVFITGGRQWRLADSYLHTRTHRELNNLLNRGGIIAGSSAGATVQGSFLVRGNSNPDDNSIMIGDHQEGFAFIKNIAIDQHIQAANRQSDLSQVLRTHPDLLGIGIDEDTAILIQHDEFTVHGSGNVFVHDGPAPFYALSSGHKYNLQQRRVVA